MRFHVELSKLVHPVTCGLLPFSGDDNVCTYDVYDVCIRIDSYTIDNDSS